MGREIRIPAMLDPHVHMRDLDWAHKATFYSETAAALAGGYWAVFDMPNTPPATISRAALELKLAAIKQQAVCDWGVYAGASQADNTAEYSDMASDTCGLKIFNNATTGDLLIDNQLMRDRHYARWPSHRLIAVHAEGDTVADILDMVRKHRKHTHFLHISTRDEVALIRQAKEEGLPVTAGVCPHHLYLTQADETHLGGFAIMKPGLKTAQDCDALWSALIDGTLDIVESDHAPHTLAEKESKHPPFGVPGLETTLPLLLTAMHAGRLTLERIIEVVAVNPRKIWGLAAPEETYALIDVDETYEITRDNLMSRAGWSPFEGMTVRGRVLETWIRGCKVYERGQVLVKAGWGRNLFQGTS